MNNESILVAVDFGPTSARAFATAVDLAARLGAPLDIVNVCPPIPIEAAEAGDPPYVAAARDELENLANIARARGLAVRTELRSETVVFGLLEAIRERDPQLVVIGSHGRRGVSRALLGSISESLARRSPVPVVIVPSPERHERAQAAAWCCRDCGHILGDSDARDACVRCGARPASWVSAPLTAGPADAGEPTVGEAVFDEGDGPQAVASVSGFVTAPAGSYDRTTPNAEIRVRRY
jgi:nucleotide-binding universal stress UspA family protein